VCDEALWPYDIARFAEQPPDEAYAEAIKTRIIDPFRVIQTMDEMRACLQSGYPFTFGFAVFESFDKGDVEKTGIMQMPDVSREHMVGGHCVTCVGYDDETQMFTIRNSWGEEWGDKGHFYMPYAFLRSNDYCDDLWHFDTVTDK
jgi:C1A family cysteine protease